VVVVQDFIIVVSEEVKDFGREFGDSFMGFRGGEALVGSGIRRR
jgi:hypothetical protein